MIRRISSSPRQRGAFTLIELLVVLAIAAVISAVTLGGFKEMREGNKRVSCSTNLTQIYQAIRLYAADEGGKYPPYEFNTPNDCTTTASGIGLWALYTFSDKNTPNTIAAVGQEPIERYMRSSKVLHCPADLANDQLYENPVNKDKYNSNFLSYQACDGSTPTYTSVRTTDKTNADWKRQLMHYDTPANFVKRLPASDTIVTYCMHHRSERNMDNVLFYDGSIQLIKQDEGGLTGWQRKPKALQ